jgi:hypothetical protein
MTQDYRKYTIPRDICGKVFPMTLCGKVFPTELCGKVFQTELYGKLSPRDLGRNGFHTDHDRNDLLPRYSYTGSKEYFQ